MPVQIEKAFDFTGKIAVVTGGGGVLCSTMAGALAQCGATVGVLDLRLEAAEQVASDIRKRGGKAIAVQANVLEAASLEAAARKMQDTYGRIDILINGAGGNKKEATTTKDFSFFDLPPDAARWVFDLNLMGTLMACQSFGHRMVEQKSGSILNIASMSALRPLTRVVAYSAAKAAVVNLTQWLAVHFAQEYSPNIRVNALVPGFFLTEQNRFLLYDQNTGALTARGQQVIAHTPMARMGNPEDLIGPALFLLSDVSSFVHGTTLVVDGGMSAFGGV